MAHEFRLPDIGEGLTEAEIVRWVVPVGGYVGMDETVVEVETDKAVVEIPSPYAGVVLHHGAAEGEVIQVGDVLVVIGEEGETWPPGGEAPGEEAPAAEPPTEEPQVSEEAAESADSEEPAPIVGTLPSEAEVLPSRTEAAEKPAAKVQALPVVRKLARELGVDLSTITGTGPEGRITREDVLAAADGAQPQPEPTPVPPVPEPAQRTIPAGARPPSERRPLSKLRRTIAANMTESWTTIPHVTTFDEVDATRLIDLRKALARRHDRKIPMEALVVKAVTPVLAAFPEFNATLDGDELVVHNRYDVGIAVDTPDGLLVAVIRNADRRSVLGLADEVTRLGSAAKERKLGVDELSGQTFTVSNIGAVGGGFGTPIVPPGTTAILSVGRAVEKPVARDGRVEIAPLLPLSLSYDHRIIDGALGRRFMAMLIENLEEPGLFLAD